MMTDISSDSPTTEHAVIDLLTAHVPVSLLIDLTTTVDSSDIYAHEPGSADWLTAPAI
jgi:hypothetical protein